MSPQYLLGRDPVATDLRQVARYLHDKRVLVTGAGGSIGSELCRQLDGLGVGELIMLDRDESALHALQLSLEGVGSMTSPGMVLCDIRDRIALERVFASRGPDVVFHAAALKHLPILEGHPAEALKTNVWGTLNVIEAALGAGSPLFVNVSSDKAANPASVLGWSKRVAERLTASAAQMGGNYVSVRFGNVLGSRGSVLDTFKAQCAAGRPLTVTDRRTTRYFMTISEAVQLVLHAALIGAPGEAMVLDMKQPVAILDLARRVAAAWPGGDPGTVFVGMRPGEKLHECLFGDPEVRRSGSHPLISHVSVPPLELHEVLKLDLDVEVEPELVIRVLRRWAEAPVPVSTLTAA